MASLNRSHKQKIGFDIETHALKFLETQGLKCIERNFRAHRGEIDLIMKDNNHNLIFVEVRYRKSEKFGGALESIDWFKQQRIISAAKTYLNKFKLTDRVICRFDVIIVSGNIDSPMIEWIKDAFEE